jgi:hypothetical protein
MPCPHTNVVWHEMLSGELLGVKGVVDLEELARELSYRLAETMNAIVSATAWMCCCGQNPAVEQIGKFALCESCRFRYLVAKAAGKEKQFARRIKNAP